LALTTSATRSHSEALNLLGGMLAWCKGQLTALPTDTRPLTIKQGAKVLNIGERTLYRLLEDGTIPFHRTGKGRGTKRIELAALESYKQQAQLIATRAPAGQATLAELRALVRSQDSPQRRRGA
jgi:excisionase family DNA binding protein